VHPAGVKTPQVYDQPSGQSHEGFLLFAPLWARDVEQEIGRHFFIGPWSVKHAHSARPLDLKAVRMRRLPHVW
jgi:hypothetical protein